MPRRMFATIFIFCLASAANEAFMFVPQRRGELERTTMPNMSYCRFRNTLADLKDCSGALEDMTTDDPVAPLSREELAAAESLVTTCLDILRLLCEISGDDLDDDLDPAKLVRRLNADVMLRR